MSNRSRAFWTLLVVAAIIYLIGMNVSVFRNILIVMLGFGLVIIIHELGHFILAKAADIKVEAFSIGFPPILAGIMKTEKGFRIRILPDVFKKQKAEGGDSQDDSQDSSQANSDEDGLIFTVGKSGKAGETEYRIGLIPFGGFVKMLGQEDAGVANRSDDPRSYTNKGVGARVAVIAAGVVFNIISAVIIFMIVFLAGLKEVPAVVGGVVPDLPAAKAGLKGGDEVIEIAGKRKNLDFGDIVMGAALSGRDEEVPLKVRHEDGTIEQFKLVAEPEKETGLKLFGIARPYSLTINNVSEDNRGKLLENTGLLPGDRIVSVNGSEVKTNWEMAEIIPQILRPRTKVVVERESKGENDTGSTNETERIESEIGLAMGVGRGEGTDETNLFHILGMVPRLRITKVGGASISLNEKLLTKIGGEKKPQPALKAGDIILAVGDVENPTYNEMREVVGDHEDKKLGVKVLRVDANGVADVTDIEVVPRRNSEGRVVIGVGLVLDGEHPVAAKSIAIEQDGQALAIPRGATIKAVDGTAVSSFYDVIEQVRSKTGRRVTINWQSGDASGEVSLDIGDFEKYVTAKSDFAELIPFSILKRLYKADGPIEAIAMGCNKAVRLLETAYVTIQRAISGQVSPKNFMGPVGILTTSYTIVKDYSLTYYASFIGLISVFIAVFNALPLLPFDGGHIVFLLIEKIKGSPVREKVQGIVLYIGWVLVLILVVYVTFHDIVRFLKALFE